MVFPVERFPKSLPPLGKVARVAGRKRSSPHVAIRAYAPIDVVSATRTSSVFGKTMQAFFAESTFPRGQCHQLKEKIPAVTPKRLPLEGKLSAKQTEEVSPYASFLCRNRRTVPSVDTSSDPLRGPPSPPRGRLLETAPLN